VTINWYAITVQPLQEFDVERQLKQQKYPAIVPREFGWRRRNDRSGRRVKRAYARFPRYVFAAVADPLLEFGKLKKDIKAIRGIVSRRRKVWSPIKMAQADVASLMEMAGRDYEATTPVDTRRPVEAGDTVQMMSGPFASQTGEVVKVAGRRAQVYLELFNSSHVVVDIPVDALDAAEK
jgi:transcription antitermination factor NusG